MKKSSWIAIIVLAIVLALVFYSQEGSSDEEIFVMAAASLQDVLGEVAEVYQAESGVDVVLNFASSGTLRKGIEEGAAPDIFLSASTKQMNMLLEQGLVEEEHSKTLVSNQVVLIAYNEEDDYHELGDIVDTDVLLAVGDPDFVPAGRYALQVMQAKGLEEALTERFLICKDVRQVLAYVDSGEAELGMVYRTDAITRDTVRIIEAYNEDESGVVQYPAALLGKGLENEAAQDFYKYLFSEEAREIFKAHGFLTTED